MVYINYISMVMTGGWLIIVLPTSRCFSTAFASVVRFAGHGPHQGLRRLVAARDVLQGCLLQPVMLGTYVFHSLVVWDVYVDLGTSWQQFCSWISQQRRSENSHPFAYHAHSLCLQKQVLPPSVISIQLSFQLEIAFSQPDSSSLADKTSLAATSSPRRPKCAIRWKVSFPSSCRNCPTASNRLCHWVHSS